MTINITCTFIVKSGRRKLWRVSRGVTIHVCTAVLASQKYLIMRYRVHGKRETRLWDAMRVKIWPLGQKLIGISSYYFRNYLYRNYLKQSMFSQPYDCWGRFRNEQGWKQALLGISPILLSQRTSEIPKWGKTAGSDTPVKGSHHLIKIKTSLS